MRPMEGQASELLLLYAAAHMSPTTSLHLSAKEEEKQRVREADRGTREDTQLRPNHPHPATQPEPIPASASPSLFASPSCYTALHLCNFEFKRTSSCDHRGK